MRDGEATTDTPIFAQISLGGNVRFKYPTGVRPEKINPNDWDKVNMRAKTTRKEVGNKVNDLKNLNRRLDSLNDAIIGVVEAFCNTNKRQPLQMELVELLNEKLGRNLKDSRQTQRLGLITYAERYIKTSNSKINKQNGRLYSNNTLRGYDNTVSVLKRFAKSKPKYRNLWFEDVTLAFYYDFMEYMGQNLQLATNTMGKHIKTIKTLMGMAEEEGLHNTTDYRHRKFKKLVEETEGITLSESELEKLKEFEIVDNDRLDNVRDLLIVGCWTGLRFSDFTTINKHNFVREGANLYLEKITQKTGNKVIIPVHDMVEEVLRKYENKTPNALPKPISNQKMNLYLKELGKLVGMDEMVQVAMTKGGVKQTRFVPKYTLITTHVCRRSFATNLYLRGVAAFDIMQMTGHKTEKMLMTYLKVKPREVANKVHEMWKRPQSNLKVV